MVGCTCKLNLGNIRKMANDYISSAAAESDIDKLLEEYLNGNGGTQPVVGGGTNIPTKSKMKEIANRFISMLLAEGAALPHEIWELLSGAYMGEPVEIDERTYRFDIIIPGDLHKESLYPEGYPEGVSNIIRLFDEGYPQTRAAVYKTIEENGQKKRITSARSRIPLNFLQKAAENFNSKLGAEWGAVVSINWDD